MSVIQEKQVRGMGKKSSTGRTENTVNSYSPGLGLMRIR